MQRVTEKTEKKIHKIKRIVAVKYDEYTPSIFRKRLRINISIILISISFLKNILKIRFVFYTLRFHVAPAQILAANQLEEELACLPQEQRLLIPVT